MGVTGIAAVVWNDVDLQRVLIAIHANFDD